MMLIFREAQVGVPLTGAYIRAKIGDGTGISHRGR